MACAGWPVKWQSKNITIRELYPIVLALKLWGSAIENKCIVCHTVNGAVVHIINNQTCQDEEIMQLVREMVVTLTQRNILFRAVHIKGILNLTADFCLVCRWGSSGSSTRQPIRGQQKFHRSGYLISCTHAASVAAVTPNTRNTYKRDFSLLKKFKRQFFPNLPIFPVSKKIN